MFVVKLLWERFNNWANIESIILKKRVTFCYMKEKKDMKHRERKCYTQFTLFEALIRSLPLITSINLKSIGKDFLSPYTTAATHIYPLRG